MKKKLTKKYDRTIDSNVYGVLLESRSAIIASRGAMKASDNKSVLTTVKYLLRLHRNYVNLITDSCKIVIIDYEITDETLERYNQYLEDLKPALSEINEILDEIKKIEDMNRH